MTERHDNTTGWFDGPSDRPPRRRPFAELIAELRAELDQPHVFRCVPTTDPEHPGNRFNRRVRS